FFFQAEDGIRDFHVTGVQTCALPIYVRTGIQDDPQRQIPLGQAAGIVVFYSLAICFIIMSIAFRFRNRVSVWSLYVAFRMGLIRSEERGVGREGGCGAAREGC